MYWLQTPGWLYVPPVRQTSGFRPLPAERGMSIRQIEDDFLEKVRQADFLYIYNLHGYIGVSAAFELGHALEWEKPVYAREPLDFEAMEEYDLARRKWLTEYIKVMPISEAVADYEGRRT